jgi:uncharacterized protein YndB with AHSA1/START domain
MSISNPEVRSIVVEREMAHPPERIWKALTKEHFIKEWLMENNFELSIGHKFNFRAEPMYGWNGVTDCEVLEIVPNERLSYSWNASGEQAENGLKTVVTWTLQATEKGTHLVMEQSGFRPQDEGGYQAMGGGWPRIVVKLEEIAGTAF